MGSPIENISIPRPFLTPEVPCTQAIELFKKHPDADSFAVIRSDGISILCRERFLSQLSTKFGFAVYENRPVSTLMENDPLVVEADMDSVQAITKASHRDRRQIFDDIIVMQKSEYFGMVAMRDLLLHSKELLAASLADKKNLEAQLHHSEKMRAVGQLAGGIAHDFNNILMAITGYCELIGLKLSRGPLWDHVQQILKASEHGAALTRQLLAFSRKQVLSPRIVQLNQVIEGMHSFLSRLLGERIQLFLECQQGLPPVRVDIGQMEQVIMNLVVNAREAMPDGGTVTLRTDSSQPSPAFSMQFSGKKFIRFAVSDTGCGMDEETQSRIFEPFFTTKDKGTGLGLATCYGIIEQSEGTIEVKSWPGEGSLFSVFLPAFSEDLPPAIDIATPSIPLMKKPTILLVDDNLTVRTALASALQANGYSIISTSKGEEAIQAAEEKEIDLLITDVIMPGMTGTQLAETLRKKFADLKVLFISGFADPAQMPDVTRPNTEFLSKPFSMAALRTKISAMMAKNENLAHL